MKPRKAVISRITKETNVRVELNLDKNGPLKINTTVPFMDHMLKLMAYHGGFSLIIKASGDTEIDDHHLIEDTGITTGMAILKALGQKKGIARYGNFLLPMDEALSHVVIDVSGRPFLHYDVNFKPIKTGFDFELLQEFFYALAINSKITLHMTLKHGRNNHHIAESLFKGFGRALAQAVKVKKNKRKLTVPSTKGGL